MFIHVKEITTPQLSRYMVFCLVITINQYLRYQSIFILFQLKPVCSIVVSIQVLPNNFFYVDTSTISHWTKPTFFVSLPLDRNPQRRVRYSNQQMAKDRIPIPVFILPFPSLFGQILWFRKKCKSERRVYAITDQDFYCMKQLFGYLLVHVRAIFFLNFSSLTFTTRLKNI